ncbi:hypothetical protein BJ741DRAFT_615712 [Chytriomyces cf. hyalinus JEL632]|nr:hypothetical protein BJ741DRAFT_615712 [Chytriomyces cf. hyalinus JEL632]
MQKMQVLQMAFARPLTRGISTATLRPNMLGSTGFPGLKATAALRPLAMQKRTMLRKISDPIQDWTVPSVQQTVQQLLFEYAEGAPLERVVLDASLENTLFIDKHDRFGFFWELCEIFQVDIDPSRLYNRDLASGREMSDWIAAYLEESGRLIV